MAADFKKARRTSPVDSQNRDIAEVKHPSSDGEVLEHSHTNSYEGCEADDEEDAEEVELIEPLLKYKRLISDIALVLEKQAASCIAINSKFLALGSHWGTITITDHLGNIIKCARLASHTTTVNQISIDDNGDYIASCSDDGKVIINGLYASDHNVNMSFDYPVKSIAIDPEYYKPGSGRRFIIGDEKLVLYEKSFMSRMKLTVLHAGDGIVRNIKWKGEFLAFSGDSCVLIYHIPSQKLISKIEREQKPNLRPELYRCNLVWKDSHTLLIGWVDWIKVCLIKVEKPPILSTKEGIRYYSEIVYSFSTDFYVSGIASLNDHLVVLSYIQENDQEVPGRGGARRPQLRILEPLVEDFDEVSTDVLALKGYENNHCNDYHLECLTDEGIFLIVSPRDVVYAEPTDIDDRIMWLLDHNKYEKAVETVKEQEGKQLKRYNLLEVGRAYVNHLLEKGEFDAAGRFCVELLGKDKTLWEQEVYKFAKCRQLRAISPYLPRGEPWLDAAIYEMVLNEFLQTDYQGFRNLIKEWPSSLYDVPTLINTVIDRLIYDPTDHTLLCCLGDLYIYERQYDKSIAIYLKLGRKDVFDLIQKYNLYSTIQDKIEPLMHLDAEKTIKMLLENLHKIPHNVIVQKLERSPELLCQFLDRLFAKDSTLGEEYHGLQVKLYAEFQPTKLLSFLRNSNYYPLQDALDVCQMFHLTTEMVFLLGRMGNLKQALQLIVEKLQDVSQAIEFCKEHDDSDLWEDLINHSLDKPSFIHALLNNIGTHVDPIIIITRIKKGMEIAGLRDSLVKILQDYSLQISLREGCKKILVSDCFGLLDKLNSQQRKGISVHGYTVCPACQGKILVGDINQYGGVIVFYCRHTFHEDCLPAPVSLCTVCYSQKRAPGSGLRP